MYRAFNITDCDWDDSFYESGFAIYKKNNAAVQTRLESSLADDVIDGTKLGADWFPRIQADIFISHSHDDQKQAIKCAGWLKDEFGLRAFVDSCVWGNAQDLLAEIDKEYCFNSDNGTYSYQKRNHSTAYVHMMLSNALNTMLDATECVFFLNTPNSITPEAAVKKTRSPWLFLELGLMGTIQRKKPARNKRFLLERGLTKEAKLIAEFEVPLDKLTLLSKDELIQWQISHRGIQVPGRHALDILYGIAPAVDES